jgi:alpha-N-arabinofuranosidase
MIGTRRHFLHSTAGAAAAWAADRVLRYPVVSAQSADSRIDILLNEPQGTIAPELYGHFVENLGGVIYDGIWVGENSKIANTGGLRQQLIDHLRKVKPPVIRWPGGCFADQYDWRDGIGPRDKRPTRTNFWVDAREWPKSASQEGPQRYDPNHVGTIEFARFCRLSGAQPYFAANLRSLPAHRFWQWVEYCNSPAKSTTLAQQREADGERDPLNIRFWGAGNESWGCGGNFAPEEYAQEFRRYVEWVPNYGQTLSMIGAGPNGGNLEWTRRFFVKLAERNALRRMWGWALHHYSWNASGGRTNSWFEGKGDAVQFDTEQYYEILREADLMESLITGHWRVMGEIDRQHLVRLVVDEWGSWYKSGTEPFPEALIGQQNTMRDALLAGLTLDTFNRHADKVAMANIAQLVNCLQSLFLAHGDKFCLTPTYHVFDMYASHQGAQAIRTVFSAAQISYLRNGKDAVLYGLNGSASLNAKQLTLTVTNPSLDQSRQTEVSVRGGTARSVKAVTLTSSDVHTYNSFENLRAVEPKEQTLSPDRPSFIHRFPPASVTKLEMTLA